MIVDSHAHLFDTSVPGARDNFPKWPGNRWGGGAPDLLRQMDEAGVDRAFLLAYTAVDMRDWWPPERQPDQMATFQHYKTREYYLQTWRQHPDRLYWFPDSIDPRVPGYVERAARDLDMGAAGLKIFIALVDTPIDDPRWQPVFELLRERRKPCVVDLTYWMLHNPWFAPSMRGRYRDYTHFAEGVHRAAEQFADVPMILAHYGTPQLRDPGDPTRMVHYDRLREPIEMIRPHPNLFAELAAYHHNIQPGEKYPYWGALRIVEILVGELGADRVIWGTDWPYAGRANDQYTYAELVRAIREAPFLKPGEAEKVLGGNALGLLGN